MSIIDLLRRYAETIRAYFERINAPVGPPPIIPPIISPSPIDPPVVTPPIVTPPIDPVVTPPIVTPPIDPVVTPPIVIPPVDPVVTPPIVIPPVDTPPPVIPPPPDMILAGSSGVILTVGPGQQYSTVQAAVNVAKDGDTIKLAPGTARESFQFSKSLLIDGQNVAWNFTGYASNGLARQKGAIVPVAPKHWIIQGFWFIGVGTDRTSADLTCAIRPDMNAATDSSIGIVRNCTFTRNQCGVGCGEFDLDLTIDACSFDNSGIDDLSHNIYIGQIRALTLTDTTSIMANADKGVHALKSRARATAVIDGRYSALRGAVINIPAGGLYTITGTQIDKPVSNNHVVIQYANENENQGLSNMNTVVSSTLNLLCANPIFELWGGTVTFTDNTFTGNKPVVQGSGEVIGL